MFYEILFEFFRAYGLHVLTFFSLSCKFSCVSSSSAKASFSFLLRVFTHTFPVVRVYFLCCLLQSFRNTNQINKRRPQKPFGLSISAILDNFQRESKCKINIFQKSKVSHSINLYIHSRIYIEFLLNPYILRALWWSESIYGFYLGVNKIITEVV